MANELTGEFDVAAEFAIPAVNRVLAAMHQAERFLHSISVHVDDDPPPGSKVNTPTVVGSVDTFGDPTVDHQLIGTPVVFPGQLAVTDPAYSALDVVLNPDVLVATQGTIVPSHLRGRAQLQLSPPTVEVPDASGTNLTARMNVMSRYFPDPNTSPLAEFIRGDLQITASVSQIASTAANVVDVDFKADQAAVSFSPSWSSQALSPEDIAGIALVIRNALKTSFLPSSAPLPSNIQHVAFRTLTSPQSAIGVLLDLTGTAGSAAGFNNVFLGSSDDFAFAVGIDYLRAVLQPTIDAIVGQPYSITIPVDVGYATYHVVYSISLTSGTLDLPSGKIVLTMAGHAVQTSHKWYAPGSFDFTARLSFTLTVDGATADLQPADVSLDTTSWIANLFSGSATDGMKQVRDQALAQSGAADTVRAMFDANRNLGDFLNSLLFPVRRMLLPQPHEFQLAYTSVEIRPSGIVLHGSLSVIVPVPRPVATLGIRAAGLPRAAGWPPPYVEFEQIPPATGGHSIINPIASGPDYSALKTWIPGGTIGQYEWSAEGQTQAYPFAIDPHKFVLLHSQPAATEGALAAVIPGYTPLCLTVRGTRISPSGPAVYDPVSAMVCSYTRVPVISPGLVATIGGAVPMLALTRPSAAGRVEVTGHASAQLGEPGGGTPNLIVHFADAQTASRLADLTQALKQSRRSDAPTAVLAVLAPDQLANAPYTQGVIYTDDHDGAWRRLFGAKATQQPVTLIVGPKGNVTWQHAGPLERDALASALGKYLVRRGPVRISMPLVNVRIGQVAPNFLFEFSPGRELPLRKLAGRPAVLVFWKSSSRPSLETLRDVETPRDKTAARSAIVLAINDGEAPELARSAAAEAGVTAVLVTDPDRRISFAYGVTMWPTIIFMDASGLITGIRYGRFDH